MSVHFIVDGYNLMKQIPHILGKNLFRDREGFIRFLEEKRLFGSRNNRVIVIFDGKEDVFVMKEYSEIKVIFTKGETADEKIKKMIEKSMDKKNLVVISNDNEIKYFAKIQGVKTMSAEEILAKIIRKKKEIEEDKKIVPETLEGIRITKELEKIWLRKEKE